MKSTYSRFCAVVSLILALAMLLSLSAGALSEQTFTFALKTPIIFNSATTSPTQEEMEPARDALRNVMQPAIDAFLFDRPLEAVWMDVGQSGGGLSNVVGQYDGTAELPYRWTASEIEGVVRALPEFTDPKGMIEALRDVVDGFVPYGETRYEKLLSFQRYICALTTYDADGTYAHNPFGSLLDYRSVCEGYAEAFKLLCDANGIPCLLVSGLADNGVEQEAHMWNYVRMEDGNWYAVDVTWDDQYEVLTNYFLVGSKTEVADGILLEDNHFPDGDISNTALKTFALPTLSENSYLVNQDSASPASAEDTANNTWYYDQLDDDQKSFYDCLLALEPEAGEYPDLTPGETDAWTSGQVTEAPETEPVVESASEGLEFTLNDDGLSYSVTGIGDCTDTALVIPSTYNGLPVTRIGRDAFWYDTGFVSVTIPNSVTSIEDNAFGNCTDLASVTVPDSVMGIGDNAFAASGLTSVTIPDSVTSLGYGAFSNCESLTSATIGSGVTIIETSLFRECTALTSVTIPDCVTSIGDYAFYLCSSLESITIPDGVTSIGSAALQYCYGLTSVTIPDSVTGIGDYAFAYCTVLTSITIPDSVVGMGNYAFCDCTNLTDIYCEAESQPSGWYSEWLKYCDAVVHWGVSSPDSDTESEDTEPIDTETGENTEETENTDPIETDPVVTEPVESAGEGLKFALNGDGVSYTVIGIGDCTDTDPPPITVFL